MKRDMDLIRQILLEIEKEPVLGRMISLDIESYSPEEASYHVMILNEAGLIEATALDGHRWIPKRLTWQGHEFLDAARSEKVWKRAIETIKDKIGSVPFVVVQQLLIKLGTEHLGLS